jgi:DNA-binding protein HU-beta
MTQKEVVKSIAESTGLTLKDSEKALRAFQETVKGAIASGDSVQLVGFGTFGVSSRAERQGRNPKTGETMTIAAKKVPTFKAGKSLKDAAN